MPDEAPRRARGWPIAVMPLAGLALFELARIALAARFPTGYAATHHPASWVYPTGKVVVCMTLILIEAVANIHALAERTTGPLGASAFVGGLGILVLGLALVRLASHGDSSFESLVSWHLLAGGWLLAVALGRGLFALGRRASR
jgi:hypothetical protein